MSGFFWSKEHFLNKCGPAIQTADGTISFKELDAAVSSYQDFLEGLNLRNNIAFLPMQSNAESVIRYLACLRASITPLLLPLDLDNQSKSRLQKIYRPAILFGPSGIDDVKVLEANRLNRELPDKLALLLSTSGSTGSPKLVRLSFDNISANARSICQYLEVEPEDKAFCNLPLSYSFGLSVLNSHLAAGACVYLSTLSPFDPKFYDTIVREKISSISGVPFFYQMLFRTGFLQKEFPSLKAMTQAGGELSKKFIAKFHEYAVSHGSKYFVMYGQTEASPRISYVPPEVLSQKIGSIGVAIPGGKLSLADDGELVYEGRNVMLGYAENIEDLFSKHELGGVLHTGDLARVDEDGFYYITGRKKRFVKLAGSRYGLDEIESFLEHHFDTPFLVGGQDEKLLIGHTFTNALEIVLLDLLQSKYAINRTYLKLVFFDELPKTPNGKKDYSIFRSDKP